MLQGPRSHAHHMLPSPMCQFGGAVPRKGRLTSNNNLSIGAHTQISDKERAYHMFSRILNLPIIYLFASRNFL